MYNRSVRAVLRSVQINRGVAQLVARLLWEHCGLIRDGWRQKLKGRWGSSGSGILYASKNRPKIGLDHMDAHRQKKLFFFLYSCYNAKNPGIAELVPRHIWDVEIVRSSRTTRTNSEVPPTVPFPLSRPEVLPGQSLGRWANGSSRGKLRYGRDFWTFGHGPLRRARGQENEGACLRLAENRFQAP